MPGKHRIPVPDAKTLQEKYDYLGSVSLVAEFYDVSYETARMWLHSSSVTVRSHGTKSMVHGHISGRTSGRVNTHTNKQ